MGVGGADTLGTSGHGHGIEKSGSEKSVKDAEGNPQGSGKKEGDKGQKKGRFWVTGQEEEAEGTNGKSVRDVREGRDGDFPPPEREERREREKKDGGEDKRGRFWVSGNEEDEADLGHSQHGRGAMAGGREAGREGGGGGRTGDPMSREASSNSIAGMAGHSPSAAAAMQAQILLPHLQSMMANAGAQRDALQKLVVSLSANDVTALASLASPPLSLPHSHSHKSGLSTPVKGTSRRPSLTGQLPMLSASKLASSGSEEKLIGGVGGLGGGGGGGGGVERAASSRVEEHRLVRQCDDLGAGLRHLVEENERLKRRNLNLERELTKCQNKLLELQVSRKKHASDSTSTSSRSRGAHNLPPTHPPIRVRDMAPRHVRVCLADVLTFARLTFPRTHSVCDVSACVRVSLLALHRNLK